MNPSSFLGLFQNAAILLAMALAFDVALPRARVGIFPSRGSALRQALFGLGVGIAAIMLMGTPWVLIPGIVFDTRSILLGISGLFFGSIPTLIALVIAVVYRLHLGGGGALTGVGVILATGLIGLAWRRVRGRKLEAIGWVELLLFGLLIHATMLGLMLTLPGGASARVLGTISLPVMTIYPTGTVLLGILIRDRLRRREIEDALRSSEARLADSLREKEALLRELYHRTKNNMQVIESMLELEADTAKGEETKIILRDMGTRIIAMALVHQMLYKTRDLSHIQFDEYIRELAGQLVSNHPGSTQKPRLSLDLEPTNVLIDIAMPCGLIVSELLSNSLKYAFPEGRPGGISLRLAHPTAEEVEFEVVDDGVGVPPGFDYRGQGGLGLQTVIELAEHQLQGRAEFSPASPSGEGFACRVRFANRFYSERI